MKNNKGTAFLVTIILLGLVLIICGAFAAMLLSDAFSIKRFRYSSQAYHLAEAGIEHAIEDLLRTNFTIPGGKSYSLGGVLTGGLTTTTVDDSKWTGEKILTLTAVGNVKQRERTIIVELKDGVGRNLDYTILADGKIFIDEGSTVDCTGSKGIHSNSSSTTDAIEVGRTSPASSVLGGGSTTSACETVSTGTYGTISTGIDSNASTVELPIIDEGFFDYYHAIAKKNGELVSGDQYYFAPVNPTGGVRYVNGNVIIYGNVTINGCIIATGDIYARSTEVAGVITLNQQQIDNLPAFISTGGEIFIRGVSIAINGLIYAPGDITIIGDDASPSIAINSVIISKGNVWLSNLVNLDYAAQTPPGFGISLNWNK